MFQLSKHIRNHFLGQIFPDLIQIKSRSLFWDTQYMMYSVATRGFNCHFIEIAHNQLVPRRKKCFSVFSMTVSCNPGLQFKAKNSNPTTFWYDPKLVPARVNDIKTKRVPID